jgi:hypothetical protein
MYNTRYTRTLWPSARFGLPIHESHHPLYDSLPASVHEEHGKLHKYLSFIPVRRLLVLLFLWLGDIHGSSARTKSPTPFDGQIMAVEVRTPVDMEL